MSMFIILIKPLDYEYAKAVPCTQPNYASNRTVIHVRVCTDFRFLHSYLIFSWPCHHLFNHDLGTTAGVLYK